MNKKETNRMHVSGINFILEYIQCNLSEDLDLKKLSALANYSPFHFHRIFLENVGETPKQYLIRLRLERVAHYLNLFPDVSISELSLDSGFSSISTFSRAFKNNFGISPEAYRKNPQQNSKNGKIIHKKSKLKIPFHPEFWTDDFSKQDLLEMKSRIKIDIKKISERKLAFVSTCLNSADAITDAFRKVFKWAEPRELITPETKFVGILLDVPFITPLEKCRYWACISVPENFKERKNGIALMPSGTYATYEYRGNIVSTIRSLGTFRHIWLEDSGYEISDIKGFEIFSENPAHKPAELINRVIHIPIKPSH